jgi:hypothetical protein
MAELFSNELKQTLAKVVSILNSNNIKHVVCGGLSLGAHMPPRMTADIDIMILETDYGKIAPLFGETFPLSMDHREGLSVKLDGFDVDFIFANAGEEFLLENSKEYMDSRVIGLFQLLYLKLKSSRVKDSADVIALAKNMTKQMRDDFRRMLKKCISDGLIDSEALHDFESNCMIADLELSGKNTTKAKKAFQEFLLNRYGSKHE